MTYKKFFDSITKSFNLSKKLLEDLNLLKTYSEPIISINGVKMKNDPCLEYINHKKYYTENQNAYLFKLHDDSIIQAGYVRQSSAIKQYRMVYISNVFSDDVLSNYVDAIDDTLDDEQRSEDDDYINTLIIKEYFKSFFHKEHEYLVESIVCLSKNPIIIRCDFQNEVPQIHRTPHPMYHLTVNNYTNSRLLMNQEVTIYSFVKFILEFIYGYKSDILKQRQKLINYNALDNFINISIENN